MGPQQSEAQWRHSSEAAEALRAPATAWRSPGRVERWATQRRGSAARLAGGGLPAGGDSEALRGTVDVH